jgi:hypothetical protein
LRSLALAAVAGNPSRIFVLEYLAVGANSVTPGVLLEALFLGGTELFCVSNSVQASFVVGQTDSGVNSTNSSYTQVADYDSIEILVNFHALDRKESKLTIFIKGVIDKYLNKFVVLVKRRLSIEGNKG